MTMKLACLRCKRKKIKCDRGEPICHQCITAKTECHYVERRQRPRLAQQKVAVQHLNERLELLEKQISATGDRHSPSTLPPTSDDTVPDITPVPSPEASLTVGDGQESWIYRLATDTRRNFQNQASPIATPTPQIDHAMMALNDALDDLGNLRVRTDTSNIDLNISVADSGECVETFGKLMNIMVVPDIFTPSVNLDLLRALPNIINSPYVNIDPGVYVMYYNALYYGLQQMRGPGHELVQAAYRKILQAVPAWLGASTDTDMDGHTAALTAWTAINNHDYQLSWKFHCKSCHYIKLKGIDQLDVIPAKTFEEEDGRNVHRYYYWHILNMDTLFRLFYGKPTVMRWSPNKIKPPTLFRPGNMHPTASQVTITVVWVRYTLMTAEIFNFIDNNPAHEPDIISQKVEGFCLQLEDLIAEFRLESLMKDMSITPEYRYLLADHTMNVYATIIGMKRLLKKIDHNQHIDAVTIRAARSVVNTILAFSVDPHIPNDAKSVFDFFITFYPFCAVFSLYEYILASPNPSDCETDLQSLEQLGAAMAHACELRRDFIPFAKTIHALNKVSRSVQDERQREQSTSKPGEAAYPAAHSTHLPPSTFDNFQHLLDTELPQFDAAGFPSLPELSLGMDGGEFHPLDFVRALENDLQNRNWHDSWWDFGGDLGGDVAAVPEGAYDQPGEFTLPTPRTG